MCFYSDTDRIFLYYGNKTLMLAIDKFNLMINSIKWSLLACIWKKGHKWGMSCIILVYNFQSYSFYYCYQWAKLKVVINQMKFIKIKWFQLRVVMKVVMRVAKKPGVWVILKKKSGVLNKSH